MTHEQADYYLEAIRRLHILAEEMREHANFGERCADSVWRALEDCHSYIDQEKRNKR